MLISSMREVYQERGENADMLTYARVMFWLLIGLCIATNCTTTEFNVSSCLESWL